MTNRNEIVSNSNNSNNNQTQSQSSTSVPINPPAAPILLSQSQSAAGTESVPAAGNSTIINNAYTINRIPIVSNRNNNSNQTFSQLSSLAAIRSRSAAAQLFLSDVDCSPANILAPAG